ncbi:MAG: signal peptidase I [Patescibacteria group bacterium]|nr:signal peptidase I [Patescibacteria group bacterium]
MIKRFFKLIYFLFLASLAVIALFLVLSVFPIKGSYQTFVVQSGSMEPKIKTGSVAVVKQANNYQVNDIITFGPAGKGKTSTTHRIIEIKETNGKKEFVTKGDVNNAPDQRAVAQDEIIGKVLFSVPYIGYAVSAAQKPIGFVLIIVVPSVFIIYDEAHKIGKEIKRKINHKKRTKKAEATRQENDTVSNINIKEIKTTGISDESNKPPNQ